CPAAAAHSRSWNVAPGTARSSTWRWPRSSGRRWMAVPGLMRWQPSTAGRRWWSSPSAATSRRRRWWLRCRGGIGCTSWVHGCGQVPGGGGLAVGSGDERARSAVADLGPDLASCGYVPDVVAFAVDPDVAFGHIVAVGAGDLAAAHALVDGELDRQAPAVG